MVFKLLFFFLSCCRDLVHRQTSMSAIQHIALGVYGFGCEDALTHLMNYVWPNIFETSPHVVQAFMGSIEGMRVGVGPSKILQYALQVPLLPLHSKTCLIQHLSNLFPCVILHFLPASPKAKAGLGVQSLRPSVRPSVCPSVRPSVPKSCHRNSSETTDPIIMKLGM